MELDIGKVKNIYHKCRLKASETNAQLKSRIGAAMLFHISPETLRDYEAGTGKVPADIVMKMAEIYNAPELRNYYCHNSCPIGCRVVPEIDDKHLQLDRLTVRLLGTFKKIADIKDKLIDIADDGIITEIEKPKLNEILETLDAISKHTQELRVWAEKEFKHDYMPYQEA